MMMMMMTPREQALLRRHAGRARFRSREGVTTRRGIKPA
jgi:hypothetical protein